MLPMGRAWAVHLVILSVWKEKLPEVIPYMDSLDVVMTWLAGQGTGKLEPGHLRKRHE